MKSDSKTCAYCGNKGQLSREHVWSRCFHDRLKNRVYAHYSPTSGNVHGSEYTVRDVCRVCNNVYLNSLANYFCNLYDCYFYDPKGVSEVVCFEFDYDLLLRCLLKIAFNTARSARSEVQPFHRTIEYIRDGKSRPGGVVLIAELVSPSYVEKREIKPTMYRSALAELRTPHGSAALLRVVAVNSFFFHILLIRDPTNMISFEKAVYEFLEKVRESVLLSPDVDSVILKSSPQDSLRSMLPLLRAKRIQYRQFFASKRKDEKMRSLV